MTRRLLVTQQRFFRLSFVRGLNEDSVERTLRTIRSREGQVEDRSKFGAGFDLPGRSQRTLSVFPVLVEYRRQN